MEEKQPNNKVPESNPPTDSDDDVNLDASYRASTDYVGAYQFNSSTIADIARVAQKFTGEPASIIYSLDGEHDITVKDPATAESDIRIKNKAILRINVRSSTSYFSAKKKQTRRANN